MTVLTAEMIAADEAKAAAQPQVSSTPSKSSAKVADFDTDPIDYTCALRIQAGGLNSTKTKQDAVKEKLQTASMPKLELADDKL